MKKNLTILLLLIPIFLFAKDSIFDDIFLGSDVQYVLRLKNGDLITGYPVEVVQHPQEGEGIRIDTQIGLATIYANQILEIIEKEEYYRHSHRIFLLPTAAPIGNDHFIGAFELMFFYAGAGIGDWLSMTGGRSVVPFLPSEQQVTVGNIKLSMPLFAIDTTGLSFGLAGGINMAFLNHDNRFVHYYGTATINFETTSITGSVFYKAGSEDFYLIDIDNSIYDIIYPDGSFGIGMGIDTEISGRHGLHFIGELWNSDVNQPTNSGVLLGLRLFNSGFSADFGVAFFMQPFVAPFASFVITPF
jgi:hypothetical protein